MTALFAAAAMVLSVLPMAGAVGTTGVWIFPHAHQSDVLAGTLSSSFYMGSNSSAWVSDSFFADSLADSANVQVDLYNPTATDLPNVQLFVAISDIALLTSIDFAGGDGGAVSVPASDIGGGTPFLADGTTLDDHGVYPAYFTSYSVGSVSAGTGGIVTIWVNVTGDFAGGLILHLDYTGVADTEVVFSGPFDADMAIFENGESTTPCEDAVVVLSYQLSFNESSPDSMTARVAFELANGMPTSGLVATATFPAGLKPTSTTDGTISGQKWNWEIPSDNVGDSFKAEITLAVSPLLLDGDVLTSEAMVNWETCDGSDGRASAEASAEIQLTASGDVHPASWWQKQIEKTSKSKRDAEFNKTELDGFLQAIALHSAMFTYGSWNGTTPTGAKDEGWLDIGSLHDALEVLKGKSGDSKKVAGIERQALALWLNVASGAVNLDTQVGTTRHCDDNDSDDDDGADDDGACQNNHRQRRSVFEQRTGLSEPGDDLDTVGEILSFAEGQSADWKDGSGVSKDDLKLGRLLCKAVNRGWLVPE